MRGLRKTRGSDKDKEMNAEILVFKEALQIEKQKFGIEHHTFTDTIQHMAIVYRDNRKYDDAMVCLQWKLKVLIGQSTRPGREKAVEIAATFTIMGNIQRRRNNMKDAIKYYMKAVQIFKSIGYRHDHPHMCILARLITRSDRYLKAGLSGKIRQWRDGKTRPTNT
eukprot:CAMPEP_0172511292 /NCGR_PEP_ID=MMETSP1066-20121228/235249_1 /TAXON_ID=671091 /ORGANISM="Coscinodiscus wailesii, Strain CCMP2513" /LENGTH=165 /DNA_ID=CAMNT_0013290603 /DNA_START=139 /DNA_END=639 /DNA_ORIENTATION=+